MEKLTEKTAPAQISVPVHGGYLKATVSGDPNYPGIDIDFYPEEGTDGSITSLARVEQDHDRLWCHVWKTVYEEDPTSATFVYDNILMAQVAYSFYKHETESPVSFDEFLHTVFEEEQSMKKILPEHLYPVFLNAKKIG